MLGVEYSDSGPPEDSWNLTTGIWVHRWLGESLVLPEKKVFVPFPEEKPFIEGIVHHSERFRLRVENVYKQAGRPLPVWWLSGWKRAQTLTVQLGQSLLCIKDWPFVSSEHNLPKDFFFGLPSGRMLHLSGRLDLLLSKNLITEWTSDGNLFVDAGAVGSLLRDQTVWVIDFKTGKNSGIQPTKFASGQSLQLALYGLALSSMGAGEVLLSIAGPGESIEKTAVLSALNSLGSLWEGLCDIQDTGHFGMLGEIRPEFGPRPKYPIATLEIDPDILEIKWSLTHPQLMEAAQ